MLSRVFFRKTTPITYYLNVAEKPFLIPTLFAVLPKKGVISERVQGILSNNSARPYRQIMTREGMFGKAMSLLLKTEQFSPIIRQFASKSLSPGKYQYYSIDSFGDRTRTGGLSEIANLMLSAVGVENYFEELTRTPYSSSTWKEQGIDPSKYIVPSGGLKEWFGESRESLQLIERIRPFSTTKNLLDKKMPAPLVTYGQRRATFQERNDGLIIRYPTEETEETSKELDALDMIPFYFKDLRTGLTHRFRAMFSAFEPKFEVSWEDRSFLGTIQLNYPIYSGYKLSYSMEFYVIANTRFELEHLWRKVNELHWLCLPINIENRLIAPVLELTLGDFVKDERGIIKEISISEYGPWEINAERVGRGKNEKFGISQIPMYVKMSLEYSSIMPARYYGYPIYPNRLTQYIHNELFEDSPYKRDILKNQISGVLSLEETYKNKFSPKLTALEEYINKLKQRIK